MSVTAVIGANWGELENLKEKNVPKPAIYISRI